MGVEDHKHKANIFFHNLGLWGWSTSDKQGWRYSDMSAISEELGHNNVSNTSLISNRVDGSWMSYQVDNEFDTVYIYIGTCILLVLFNPT